MTISDSVTNIGVEAFYACAGLTGVTMGNNVARIGEWAFWSCSSLTSITIPKSVGWVGGVAFPFCTSLTDVYFELVKLRDPQITRSTVAEKQLHAGRADVGFAREVQNILLADPAEFAPAPDCAWRPVKGAGELV